MTLRPSFTKRPVAAAPGTPLHGPNSPPLRAGNVYLNDETRKELALVGHQGDDPVPEGLPAVIAQVTEKYKDIMAKVDEVAGKTRLGKPKTVKLADLPVEARREIQDYLEHATAILKADAKTKPSMVPPNASPAVREAIEQYEQQREPQVVVEDDADEPVTPPAADDTKDAKDAPAETAPEPHCPQCGYDCRIPFDVQVTPEDTQRHIAAVLDRSPNSRFRKTAAILDGQMTIMFRSLTTTEANAAKKQTRKDVIDGKIMGEAEYYMNYMEYRLAMSVEKLIDANGAPIVEVPPLKEIAAEILADDATADPLPKLVEWMDEHVFTDESLKRLIGQHHRRFQHLIEALEAQESDPSFCRGIETSP